MSDSKLGLWQSSELKSTVSTYSGNRYYQSFPEPTQFVHSVAKILVARRVKDKTSLCAAPSIYVLGPAPAHSAISMKREPAFSLGGTDVSGRIWFGAAAMNSSTGCQLPKLDADAIFTFTSKDLGAGSLPAIYFDGSSNDAILRFYPKGIDEPDECLDVPLGGANITEESLKFVLDQIHERSLMTPTASIYASDLWENAAKCYPSENAENRVQGILEIGLALAMGNVRVKREGTGVYGRYDLSLVEQDVVDPSVLTNHAILELKVIRGFTKSGNKVTDTTNQTAVLKGLRQAFAYRHEHGSRISALCCFDMRPSPNLQAYAESKCTIASSLKVRLWAWPLFHKTEAARDQLAAKQGA